MKSITVARISVVLIPVLAATIIDNVVNYNARGNSLDLAMLFVSIGALPNIFVIGLLTTFLSRKSKKANLYSVLGFGVPTILFYSYMLWWSFP